MSSSRFHNRKAVPFTPSARTEGGSADAKIPDLQSTRGRPRRFHPRAGIAVVQPDSPFFFADINSEAPTKLKGRKEQRAAGTIGEVMSTVCLIRDDLRNQNVELGDSNERPPQNRRDERANIITTRKDNQHQKPVTREYTRHKLTRWTWNSPTNTNNAARISNLQADSFFHPMTCEYVDFLIGLKSLVSAATLPYINTY
ncbi:hypothetical protein B0H13DRAFT_1917303 [Mycena leptocephala]|nr:hypothetical protein B0H13DRAFT_1917303 [Mycena leptocephala]